MLINAVILLLLWRDKHRVAKSTCAAVAMISHCVHASLLCFITWPRSCKQQKNYCMEQSTGLSIQFWQLLRAFHPSSDLRPYQQHCGSADMTSKEVRRKTSDESLLIMQNSPPSGPIIPQVEVPSRSCSQQTLIGSLRSSPCRASHETMLRAPAMIECRMLLLTFLDVIPVVKQAKSSEQSRPLRVPLPPRPPPPLHHYLYLPVRTHTSAHTSHLVML